MDKKAKITNKWTNLKEPGSFTSLTGFMKNQPEFRNVKNTENALLSLESYSTHKKRTRKKKIFPRIISGFKNFLWTSDLIDYSRIKSSNNGNSYILVVVCMFSKYTYLRPIRHKNAEYLTAAFKEIFDSTKQVPWYLWFDKEKAIVGKKFKKLMDDYNIKLYHVYSPRKASAAERRIQVGLY
jgi:hypothetical protein